MGTQEQEGAARRRRSPALALALLLPLVATAVVAVLAGAPRSPIAYCRPMESFFFEVDLAQETGFEPSTWSVLAYHADLALAAGAGGVRDDLRVLHDTAVHLADGGTEATSPHTQPELDAAFGTVLDDYETRCSEVLEAPPGA